jgi:methionyl-tRNA formyltransferase
MTMKIVFMGTPEFSLNVLQALINSEHDVVGVVTQPDKLVGRKQVLTPTPVKQLALDHGIPVFQPIKIRQDYDTIVNWQPDLIVTCAYGQIIPKVLLDLPPFGAINVHASLLPKYRGGAPIQWAMINGDDKTGITIMYMAEKMDAGDIINQREVIIEKDDNIGTLHHKLSEVGAQLLVETLPSIFNRTNSRTVQDEGLVTYAYNISKEDERIDWKKSGLGVVNHIRALNPWPGAYTTIDGSRFKIYQAELMDEKTNKEIGQIIRVENDRMIVASGSGDVIAILEGQLEGRKRQTMKDVLNGNHPFDANKTFE